jgi:membrane-bound serine protease (ClpP class)
VPGFGLPGISGIILVVTGTVLAMDNLPNAILSISISIIITAIVTVILMKLGFKSKLLDDIILKTNHNSEVSSIEFGKEDLTDKEGIAISELRPTGFIEIAGERYDALTEGGYLPKGTPILVIKVEGNKIFVRRK